MKLTLYCEPNWRPETAVTLGPNEIYCPSFEENADSGTPNEVADNWTLVATPTPDWEDTIVLHGCRSQKLVTDAVNEGIQSTAFPSGAAGRNAVAYAWIYRPAGGEVRLQMYETGVAIRGEAFLSTPGWQTATGKDGASTWYRVVVSGTMPNNANHHLVIIADDAATTFYVDKCYWEWDTLVCPDEWCDHWKIYNHYDARWLPRKPGGAGAGHEGHQNYFDVDGLKGDTESRLFARVEFDIEADEGYARHLWVGRRTRDNYCSFAWWIEAEEYNAVSNWALAGGLARCSAGECISNAVAPTTGYVQWQFAVAPLANIFSQLGKFDVFAAVFTNDHAHTSYRLSWGRIDPEYTNKWVKQTADNQWELIHLGSIYFDPYIKTGRTMLPENLWVHYQKDTSDTVKLDFIWFVPKDEDQMVLNALPVDATLTVGLLAASYHWVIGNDDDFLYIGIEDQVPPRWREPLSLRGKPMGIVPQIENRLYFVCETYENSSGVDIYECHGATNLQMRVNIDYLPQYVSPLE